MKTLWMLRFGLVTTLPLKLKKLMLWALARQIVHALGNLRFRLGLRPHRNQSFSSGRF
jgi:hypothetical protein